MNTIELVQRIFDADHYLASYPDASEAGTDAWQHFLEYGLESGRDPGPLFDGSYYLAQNPDVAASGIPALNHFLEFGLFEGRVSSSLFDADYYLAENPDVAASGMQPFFHFILHGKDEGRSPSAQAPAADAPDSGASDTLDAPVWLLGTDGADHLTGGSGADVLVGAGGDDVLYGGAGQDIFGFAENFGKDVIQDFTVGEDFLRMISLGIGDYADLQDAADVQVVGQDTSITFVGGSSLTLVGVTDPASLDFIPLPLM